MARVDTQSSRTPASSKNDLHEARPLLQAIFLGILLAAALVAAAAMATPKGANGERLPLTTATDTVRATATATPAANASSF
ncbi:hypothetical protein [Roseibium sp. M-1]